MIQRQDRVTVWASELGRNDFPPVCALTGRPAETWRKFNFATPPTWAYALLILVCLGGLGFIIFAIVISVIAQRASGHLPLTRASNRTVSMAFWVPIDLLLGGVLSIVAAIAFGSAGSDVGATIFGWLAVFLILGGIVGRLVFTPLLSVRARVSELAPGATDRIVELRHVHPAFVAAVQQHQQARAAQFQASQPPQPGPYIG